MRDGYPTCPNPYRWIHASSTQDKAVTQALLRDRVVRYGLQRMVESDTYCIDVSQGVRGDARAAGGSVGLSRHLGHCVKPAIEAGRTHADAKVK